MSRPTHISPVEWELALAMARSVCAAIFKQGGHPIDALQAYGFARDETANWQTAIEGVAFAHCQHALQNAA